VCPCRMMEILLHEETNVRCAVMSHTNTINIRSTSMHGHTKGVTLRRNTDAKRNVCIHQRCVIPKKSDFVMTERNMSYIFIDNQRVFFARPLLLRPRQMTSTVSRIFTFTTKHIKSMRHINIPNAFISAHNSLCINKLRGGVQILYSSSIARASC
jgi:hypothetical protein